MATQQSPPLKVDRYVVIHVATTCDEHGVYVTKDSAEVIELGWILLDAGTLDEVGNGPRTKSLDTILTRHRALGPSGECSCQAHQHANYTVVQ